MKRYVFYDRETGEIAHTHYVANADRDFVAVDESDLEALVERMVDTTAAACLVANLKPLSSRAALRTVDTKRGRVVTSRIRRSASRAERRKEAN